MKLWEKPSVAEIEAFETQWKCQLPQDYRNYILEHGCLFRMKYWFDGFPYDAPWDTPGNPPDPISPDFLSEPCPITLSSDLTEPTEEDYARIDRRPLPGETASQTEARAWREGNKISRAWIDKLPPHKIDPFQGTICIAYYGCTYYDLLIVTGEARGHILHFDMSYCTPSFDKFPNFAAYADDFLSKFK